MSVLSELSLPRLLEKSAVEFAERPCVSFIDQPPFTYSEFRIAVSALGQWLSEQGITFGDKVAIIADNSPQWAVAYFAITCMGAVAVPVLTEFHPDAMVHIIRHSEAKAIFVSDKLLHKIEGAAFDPQPLIIDIETFSPIDQNKDKLAELKSAGIREFRKWKEKAMRFASKVPEQVRESDPAVIVYTSGTTGHSKGVVLTHKNLIANALSVGSVEKVLPTDRFLSVLPLAHTYECTVGLIMPILNGAHVVYLGKIPTARILLPALQQVKPTLILTVPLILEKIYKQSILPKFTQSWFLRFLYKFPVTRGFLIRAAGKKLLAAFGGNLRALAISGAPIATDVEKFLYEANFPYIIGYGMTECSPLVAGSRRYQQRLGSTGPAVKNVKIRIGSADPVTGIGEVQVYGPNVMQGYLHSPEITAETMTEDGWLRTGDLGSIDDDGFLSIRGRLKNMILGPSGENIYPEEIESFFFAFPYVSEVLVYMSGGKVAARVYLDSAVIDSMFGQSSPAELQKQTEKLLEEARETVNKQVASFSRVIKITEQTEPFEKTATQKIKRYLYVDS